MQPTETKRRKKILPSPIAMETAFGCIPGGLECVSESSLGRLLIADRPFAPGEVVMSSVPYAYVLLGSCVENRCSYCLEKASSLKRCAQCMFCAYCDPSCQRLGWQQHRLECKALEKCRGVSLGNEQLLSDIRLVYISDLRRRTKDAACTRSPANVSCCGAAHFKDLAVGPRFIQTAVSATARIVALLMTGCGTSASAYEALLARFACNNFGLLDELLGCIGAAVSPSTALLNHSCAPNCVLRFVLTQGRPPQIQVVAVKPISRGSELTHSYVELVEDTDVRQNKLMRSYGFNCTCNRCHCGPGGAVELKACHANPPWQLEYRRAVKISAAFAESGSYECFLPSFNKVQAATESVTIDIEAAGAARLDRITSEQYTTALQQAQICVTTAMRCDDINAEVRALETAVELTSRVCGPFHTERYRMQGLLLSAYIVQGNVGAAVRCCSLLVGYLHFMLATACPGHPLLGLQLFTLGDLLCANGAPDIDISHVYSRAHKILLVTHGQNSNMVRRLRASGSIGVVS